MSDRPTSGIERAASDFDPMALTPIDTAQRGSGPFIWRFTLFPRILHAFVILSFYVLVLTGVPLRYACAPFSAQLMTLWGGVQSAGSIHRVAAGVMVGYTLVYLFWLAKRLIESPDRKSMLWGSNSMTPHPRDVREFFQMWKWFFGRGERPRFGRYGYLEKLDYLGEVWGFIIIGGSGFILWFPEFWGQYLPGWWFNVATVFHGYEALIAAGFIFIVHFFNVHLRPDKFPLDAVMFHGRATRDYMVEEHAGLVDEIDSAPPRPFSEVPVPDAPAPPPSALQTIVSAVLGMFALGVGIICIGLIVWAVAVC